MSQKINKIEGIFNNVSRQQTEAIVKGEADIPSEWEGMDIVDLGAIPVDMDFETPGLHKRIRAGVGSALGRSNDYVQISVDSEVIESDSGYPDYDRRIHLEFDTIGSAWGSSRGAIIRTSSSYHVTGSGTVEETSPKYALSDYLLGVFTDYEGVPRTIGKLLIPHVDRTRYFYDGIHPEVESMHKSLTARARALIIESFFSQR